MKSQLLHQCLRLLGLAVLGTSSLTGNAQITNGDFETQYAGIRPSREVNIKGDNSNYVDQLPAWSVPNASSSSVIINASFLATNASSETVNPSDSNNRFSGSFSPHNNSAGCVGLKRSLFYPAYDGLITQPVTLTPDHRYQFRYYIMKRPGSAYASRFAFNVINSASTPVLSATNSTSALVPTPYATVATDLVTSMQWTYVTGSFIARTPPANTQAWVVLGYDRSDPQTDPTPGSGTNENEIYIIDDVSLQDMGCAPPSFPRGTFVRAGTSCYYDYQMNPIPGATSYSVQLSNGDTGGGYINSTTNGYVRFGLMELGSTTVDVTVTVANSCATTTTTFTRQTTPPTPANCTYRIAAPTQPTSTTQGTQSAYLEAYPNPATSLLAVAIPADLLVESVELLNVTGQIVRNLKEPGNSITLQTAGLATGLYLLRVSTTSGILTKQIQVTTR